MTPARIHLLIGICLSAFSYAAPSAAQTATNTASNTNASKAEMEAAIHQVEKIANQTVPAFQRTKGMHVSEFKPGWFHPGAIKPDFNHVDVRTTRETAAFDQHE